MTRLLNLARLARELLHFYKLTRTQLQMDAAAARLERNAAHTASGVLLNSPILRGNPSLRPWWRRVWPFSLRPTRDESSAFHSLWPQLRPITMGGALTIGSKRNFQLLAALALTNGCPSNPDGSPCVCFRCRSLASLLLKLSNSKE